MVWSWQLWLSSRPAHRTNIATQTKFTTAGNAAVYDFLTEDDGSWGVRETHYMDSSITRAGLSGPPLHVHLFQDEYFTVEKGVLGVVTDSKTHALTKADGTLKIKAGTRHRFWFHESSTEDVVFRGWIDSQDKDQGLDRDVLRNYQGYIVDCRKNNLEPSFFQLALIMYDASTILTPPFWMPLALLTGLNHMLARWMGQYLLGYKSTYPEYTGDRKSR
ncbi:hypothetical protein HD806DRAFT_58928 [Xylariaceae sp. AK1471]|nr:hypothetical protein HD806DRAFT_58928 [Xylariaceae sp. AK1471]